jgi:hypothetical protein
MTGQDLSDCPLRAALIDLEHDPIAYRKLFVFFALLL